MTHPFPSLATPTAVELLISAMPFGVTHRPLVQLANSAITSFFREIEVIGSENVPVEGPIIL